MTFFQTSVCTKLGFFQFLSFSRFEKHLQGLETIEVIQRKARADALTIKEKTMAHVHFVWRRLLRRIWIWTTMVYTVAVRPDSLEILKEFPTIFAKIAIVSLTRKNAKYLTLTRKSNFTPMLQIANCSVVCNLWSLDQRDHWKYPEGTSVSIVY